MRTINQDAKLKRSQTICWTVAAFAAVYLIALTLLGKSTEGGLLIIPMASVFALVHGIPRYGGKNMLVFFVISSVVSWGYETLSVLTGFPFGNYHYSDILDPKLGVVPFIIPVSYFCIAYIAWTVGQVLLDQQNSTLQDASVFTLPLIGTFVMVLWDLSFDPYAATMNGAWIWEEGGGYFGVPIENFLGWYLCNFTIFILFSIYLRIFYYKKQGKTENVTKGQMLAPCAMYGVLSLQYSLNIFIPGNQEISSLDGLVWETASINEALTIVCLFTMVFVAILSITKLLTSQNK